MLSLACAAFAAVSPADAARRGRAEVDPVGSWSCVIYGHPAFGDERVLLHVAGDGTARLARDGDDGPADWSRLGDWTIDDDRLTFSDSKSGRRFEADLTRATLGGSWRTFTLVGGWWCSAASFDAPTFADPRARKPSPPLVPERTATPTYPLQAIREARQGRAVTCFLVTSEGRVVEPELIELSDEIFRAPILAALEHSRYRPWDDAQVRRPGCRSFVFKLDDLGAESVTAR